MHEHAPAILAAQAIYCIHGRIIDQAIKGPSHCPKCQWKARTVPIGCHSKHASAVERLKLLIPYNDLVDYKGENGQQ